MKGPGLIRIKACGGIEYTLGEGRVELNIDRNMRVVTLYVAVMSCCSVSCHVMSCHYISSDT